MDCNTCLSHVICMLFLAVIISTVLHGVLKTRTYHDRNKCNIPCIYVCNPISLHANLILNPFFLLLFFAELQSCSYCQALFFLFFSLEKKHFEFKVYLFTLFTHEMFTPLSSLAFFLLKKNDSFSRFLSHYLLRSR